MRQPKGKTRRCRGGLRDDIIGVVLAHHTPTPPGWMFVRGDSDALDTIPCDRSIGLLVRIDCIVAGPELVRGCREVRSIIEVIHRGGIAQVRADDEPRSLMQVIEARRTGGAR